MIRVFIVGKMFLSDWKGMPLSHEGMKFAGSIEGMNFDAQGVLFNFHHAAGGVFGAEGLAGGGSA